MNGLDFDYRSRMEAHSIRKLKILLGLFLTVLGGFCLILFLLLMQYMGGT